MNGKRRPACASRAPLFADFLFTVGGAPDGSSPANPTSAGIPLRETQSKAQAIESLPPGETTIVLAATSIPQARRRQRVSITNPG